MSSEYSEYLKELLRPLGIYRLEDGCINTAELETAGETLDACAEELERAEREALVMTAEQEGLSRREMLFPYLMGTGELQGRREAIAALCRIDRDCFSRAALNRTLRGCGIPAEVEETEVSGRVRVHFPETIGVPEGFEQIRQIILDILPCHLEVDFRFRYLRWSEWDEQQKTWQSLENTGYTWRSLELAVP